MKYTVLETEKGGRYTSYLFEKSQLFEALTFKQIRALIWWEWFKPKKINKFYEMLHASNR